MMAFRTNVSASLRKGNAKRVRRLLSLKPVPNVQELAGIQLPTKGEPFTRLCVMRAVLTTKVCWLLKDNYGDQNGKWCCKAGCGTTWDIWNTKE